jgi:hypothetical protein
MRSPVSMLPFEKDRNAMQRTLHPALATHRIRATRHRERIGVQFHHRVHARPVLVEGEDARDVCTRKRFGSQTSRSHRGLQLRDGGIFELESCVRVSAGCERRKNGENDGDDANDHGGTPC